MNLSPLRLTIYDKDNTALFPLPDYRTLTITLRHLATSSGTLTIDPDHPRADSLFQAGRRYTIDYYLDGADTAGYLDPSRWLRLSSGRVSTIDANGPLAGSSYANISLIDDFDVVNRTLVWPVPTAAVTAQTDEYRTLTGPCETVFKTLFQENVITRLGQSRYVVASDEGRGDTITVEGRFDLIDDLLGDYLAASGLGLSFVQGSDGHVMVDVYETADLSSTVTASEASGTLTGWEVLRSDPSGTHAVVGGDGDGTARVFAVVEDPNGEADEWGDIHEVFVEDTSLSSSTDLVAYGETQLADLTSTAGVSAEMVDTRQLQFGTAYWLGDTIGFVISPTLTMSEQVTAVTVTWSVDDGLTVSPETGDSETQSADVQTARAISALAKGLRRTRTRR